MLDFETNHYQLYNHLIANFFKVELKIYPQDYLIKWCFPKYLYHEQKKRCEECFLDLVKWVRDDLEHPLDALHNYCLYNFLKLMEEEKAFYDDDFKDMFVLKKTLQEIKKEAIIAFEENDLYPDNLTRIEKQKYIEMEMDYFLDITDYYDVLFRDLDFLMLDNLYNMRNSGLTFLEKNLRIDIDDFFEILPKDIQNKYPTGHITLVKEIEAFLDFLENKINSGSLYKLFWDKNKMVNEQTILVILDNMLTAYFARKPIELAWELKLLKRRIEITIEKRFSDDNPVVISLFLKDFKELDRFYLRNIVEKDTIESIYYFGFLAFNDKDYQALKQKFWGKYIFDLRKKIVASKLT